MKGIIKVDLAYDNGIVKIRIVDNGAGIKKEMQSCIFEPFAYVTAQCNQNETRIGIHMYLCNEIIKLLNGKIEISSEEKKGTDILIQVPTLDPSSESLQGKLMQTDDKHLRSLFSSNLQNAIENNKKVTIVREKRGLSNKDKFYISERKSKDFIPSSPNQANNAKPNMSKESRILVVDDNNSNIFVMKSMISKFKIPCDTAYNGQQAVEMVTKLGLSNYRVVLMDINMPIMNGIEATQKIKELEAKGVISAVPVIACSAQEEEKVKSASFEAGVEDFLEKPVSISKIEAIIKKHCQ